MRAAARPSTMALVTASATVTPMRDRAHGHTVAVATRVTSSTFVGRSMEMGELEVAFADAAAGRPALAFVAGDSGVGKTRLVDELASRAKASGGRVLSGDCVELGEGELPYAPVVAALRALARTHDPILEELPPAVRTELATLLPELADTAPPPSAAPPAGRARARAERAAHRPAAAHPRRAGAAAARHPRRAARRGPRRPRVHPFPGTSAVRRGAARRRPRRPRRHAADAP